MLGIDIPAELYAERKSYGVSVCETRAQAAPDEVVTEVVVDAATLHPTVCSQLVV